MSINRHFWKLPSRSDAGHKGPLLISERWPALPAVIDSAFEDVTTKKIYFFSGNKTHTCVVWIWKKFARGLNGWFGFISTGTKFWVYTGKSVLGPRSIEKLGLPSSVQKVEGALQRGKGKVLLFSGENFWRRVDV